MGTDPEKVNIREEIYQMVEEDQNQLAAPDLFPNRDGLVLKHTEKIKEILADQGWLKLSEYGEGTLENLWMLVQHSDHDIPFQEQCLQMMKSLPEEEVIKRHIAMLTDRILVNTGQPQIYGSQIMRMEKGKRIPWPIENEAGVEERRAAMGMRPLSEYLSDTSWQMLDKVMEERRRKLLDDSLKGYSKVKTGKVNNRGIQ